MIQSIRADHLNFQMYCNSTVLINILNSFAKTDCALPPHWEKKIDRKTKKVVQTKLSTIHLFLPLSAEQVVFIDHNNHVTTFIDPRLPYEGNNLTPRQDSAPAVVGCLACVVFRLTCHCLSCFCSDAQQSFSVVIF